jgi:hypothetical protein
MSGSYDVRSYLKGLLRRQRLLQQSRRLSFQPERRSLPAAAAQSRCDPDHVRPGKLRSAGTQSRIVRHSQRERDIPTWTRRLVAQDLWGPRRGSRLALVAQDAAASLPSLGDDRAVFQHAAILQRRRTTLRGNVVIFSRIFSSGRPMSNPCRIAVAKQPAPRG